MFVKLKVAFIIAGILALGTSSYGQKITYKVLMELAVSKEKSDAIMKSLQFVKGPYLDYTATQVYLNSDSSEECDFHFDDSTIICVFWTKNFKQLKNIITAGMQDGFVEDANSKPGPNASAYRKAKYLLLLNDNLQQDLKSNVSLSLNFKGQIGKSATF